MKKDENFQNPAKWKKISKYLTRRSKKRKEPILKRIREGIRSRFPRLSRGPRWERLKNKSYKSDNSEYNRTSPKRVNITHFQAVSNNSALRNRYQGLTPRYRNLLKFNKTNPFAQNQQSSPLYSSQRRGGNRTKKLRRKPRKNSRGKPIKNSRG